MSFNNCPLVTPFGTAAKVCKQLVYGGKIVATHASFTLMMRSKYKKGVCMINSKMFHNIKQT